MSVCVYVHARQLKESERQHSRVLKQLRALIRLQAEISLDDKNSGTGLEEVASRAAGGGMGAGVTGNRMVYKHAHISGMLQPWCPGAHKIPHIKETETDINIITTSVRNLVEVFKCSRVYYWEYDSLWL